MAKKGAAKSVAKKLVDSEIPEIRNIISELTKCTKRLEERSRKLQSYVGEIEDLTGGEVETSPEVPLSERLKLLEQSLTELDKRAERPSPRPEFKEEIREVPRPRGGARVYTTPEGFVVRRLR